MTKVTGSIQLRNGIYQMMVRYTDIRKGPIQKSRSTKIRVGETSRERKSNRRKADLMLAEWIEELEEQHTCEADQRLMQAIEEWMKRKKSEVYANSYQGYESYVKNHLKPYFQSRNPYLKEVTVLDIQRYIDYEHRAGLSAQSIKKFLVVLNGVFNDACRLGQIKYNPCDKAKLPKTKAFKSSIYTAEQAATLVEGIKDDPARAAIMLAVFLGLRRSEIAGLRWQDVDFELNQIHIRNTVVRFSKLLEDEHTKSESSRRDLSIPDALRTYLLELKAEQDHNRKLCGDSYIDSGHVCQWPNGKAQTPDYIYDHYKKIQKKCGLPSIRLHDLRHTAGSLLINNGKTAKQVQEFLGHEDVTTTLNVYTHTDVASKKDTADTMNMILSS